MNKNMLVSQTAKSYAIFAFCVFSFLPGCKSENSDLVTVEVQGVITFDNERIANGEIRFRPMEGTAGFVGGAPIKDGRYHVKNKGGVPIGKHKVVVRAYTTDSTIEMPAGAPDTAGAAEFQYIPERYNEKSELIAYVSGEEDPQTIDFSLESESE